MLVFVLDLLEGERGTERQGDRDAEKQRDGEKRREKGIERDATSVTLSIDS